MEPPKSLPRPVGQTRDGSPKIEGGHRFRDANSIALRRLCSRLKTDDPVQHGPQRLGPQADEDESGPALRATNPITGKKPRAFHVKSSTQRIQLQRHEKDGVGFDASGRGCPARS